MIKNARLISLVMALILAMTAIWSVSAQNRLLSADGKNDTVAVNQLTPEQIIKRFTEKESELREVWKEYSYQQESLLQVLGPADTVSGEYYQVSDFVFNDAGRRIERIIKAPPSTLDRAGLRMTQEDKNAFINLQPFALSSEDLVNYNVYYVGKERVDELDTYVFDVKPKVMSNSRELKRMKSKNIEGKYFQGRIWVDDQDLQIVKTAGKVMPEFEQRFPKFETYRENIDGRYWFPTYTYSDDTLEFDRFRVKVRMVIKYKNYRQFQSDVKLTGVEEVFDDTTQPASPSKGKPEGGETPAPSDEKKKEQPKKPKPERPRP